MDIKFRIWDIETKQFFYWDITQAPPSSLLKGYVRTSTQLYTGLKDRLGKEIYEGDIIKFEVYNYDGCLMFGYVEYWETNFRFGIYRYKWINKQGEMTIDKEIGSGGFPLDCIKALEVIGNIYENKNLLDNNSGEMR